MLFSLGVIKVKKSYYNIRWLNRPCVLLRTVTIYFKELQTSNKCGCWWFLSKRHDVYLSTYLSLPSNESLSNESLFSLFMGASRLAMIRLLRTPQWFDKIKSSRLWWCEAISGEQLRRQSAPLKGRWVTLLWGLEYTYTRNITHASSCLENCLDLKLTIDATQQNNLLGPPPLGQQL